MAKHQDDCIAVTPRPSAFAHMMEAQRRSGRRRPLDNVDVEQSQNKRRRLLDCVLVPKSDHALELDSSPSGPLHSKEEQDNLEQLHDDFGVRQTASSGKNGAKGGSRSAQSEELNSKPLENVDSPMEVEDQETRDESDDVALPVSPKAESPKKDLPKAESPEAAEPTTGRRPRRSVARTSYVTMLVDSDGSEEELQSAPQRRAAKQPTKGAKRRSTGTKKTEDSDFEDAGEASVESEGSADLASDDGSSMASIEDEEDFSDAPPKSKARSKKASIAPSETKKPMAGSARGRPTSKKMKKLTSNKVKGLDESLPQLSNIEDIFADIHRKAVKHGLQDALDHLDGSPLRVATMCSGTESPLLALELLRDQILGGTGNKLDVQHLFSAEIVPYKQAYIERNFNPPIIFRDITEITSAVEDEVPMATTAYGAKIAIPKDVHILIAGTSCVDFSNLNNHKKDLHGGGESDETWHAVLAYCKAFQPAIVLLENVFYAYWDDMLDCYSDAGYESAGVMLDSKDFYMPQTRQRGYMVCFNREAMKAGGVKSGIGNKWADLMETFKRRASSPFSSFLLSDGQAVVKQGQVAEPPPREVDWAKCEITQMQYRQTKRLGNARPFTRWQESGTIDVPENGDPSWYRTQVERVKDTIECAILRNALASRGAYDSRFKTRLWDLSQNVYRNEDRTPFGIAGCITPSGQFFVSDTNRVLAPEELLTLQGIPLSKISFTTETPSEIQDMAGNAMTSSAVGCAVVTALLAGFKLFQTTGETAKSVSRPSTTTARLTRHDGPFVPANDRAVTREDFTSHAREAMRRCFCEGDRDSTTRDIQQCLDCGHTTCTACGGNPAHRYASMQGSRRPAGQVDIEIRSQLPLAVKVDGTHESFGSIAGVFTFDGVRRSHSWIVTYAAPCARLDLVINDNVAEWQLYSLPDQSLPQNDPRRLLLAHPIARAAYRDDLKTQEWRTRTRTDQGLKLKVSAEGRKVPSWWARSQMPDFEGHDQPDTLRVKTEKGGDLLQSPIDGVYRYLPRCGKASDSLYKKDGAGSVSPVFLYLDPSFTGDPKADTFVFTTSLARLDHGESREVIARIDASWRPWDMAKDTVTVGGSVDGVWIPADKTFCITPHDTGMFIGNSAHGTIAQCGHASSLVQCLVPQQYMHTADASGNKADDPKFLVQNNWIFEGMRRELGEGAWAALKGLELESTCHDCSPEKPALRWKLAPDGDSIKPFEDTAGAVVYERALKSRPAALVIDMVEGNKDYDVAFGVDVASLAHRAAARLQQFSGDRSASWRLVTVAASDSAGTPTFEVQATRGLEAYGKNLQMSIELFPQQLQSLAWMLQQENGAGKTYTLEATEEAIVPVLNWRAEVRVQVPMQVRGGICADHPGFGKTITSLALIQAQLLKHSADAILSDMRSLPGTEGLIALSATLIVCPGVLVQQWLSEIEEKLPGMDVITINVLSDLAKKSTKDFQKAKIIIVNRSIFSNENYAERLATFAGMPGPATKSGRSYAKWLEHATSQVPEHLAIVEKSGWPALSRHVKTKYKTLMQSDEFKTQVPSRRLRGKAYSSGGGAASKTMTSKTAATPELSIEGITTPLLQMFYFNRLIVDEFHEYEPKEYASLKALKADKVWGLSATPAMDDLYDVSQMAGLLGVHLPVGSDAKGRMKKSNIKALRQEMTDFEKFDHMRQMPSTSTQARLHENAQSFLDTFVRRNVMDFAELRLEEHLVPVGLDLAHRSLYTELSQHLNSNDMRIKKGTKKNETDRQSRLNQAVADAQSAEEALSRYAAVFDRNTVAVKSSDDVQSLMHVREQEVEQAMSDLRKVGLKAVASEHEALHSWRTTRLSNKTLGDSTVIAQVNAALGSMNAKPSKPAKGSKKEDDEEAGATKAEGKNVHTSQVNTVSNRLLAATRSLRFLQGVQRIRDSATRNKALSCDVQECKNVSGADSFSPTAVSALCGHTICSDCYDSFRSAHHTQCSADGCFAPLHDIHLLWSTKMGDLSQKQQQPPHPYGAKLAATITTLLEIKSQREKAILFVQYPSQLDEAELALSSANIPATIVKNPLKAGQQITDFRQGKTDATVIVLNASDETAAGSNLQCANHVLFLSPLLRDSQYGYDSTMAQAIGRVRRHGQEKTIHVWRVVALDTIDVDVLEHRERRSTALVERGAESVEPPGGVGGKKSGKAKRGKSGGVDEEKVVPERTQLVREKGVFSLRPRSWLVGGGEGESGEGVGAARVRGKARVLGWEDFSSLVKFSRAYTEDDD